MFTPATDQRDLLTMYFFQSVMEIFGFGSFVFLIQAKHMIMLRDSVIQDVIQFLEHCEGSVSVPSHDTFLKIVVVVTHSHNFFVALRVLQKKVNFSLYLCFFFSLR